MKHSDPSQTWTQSVSDAFALLLLCESLLLLIRLSEAFSFSQAHLKLTFYFSFLLKLYLRQVLLCIFLPYHSLTPSATFDYSSILSSCISSYFPKKGLNPFRAETSCFFLVTQSSVYGAGDSEPWHIYWKSMSTGIRGAYNTWNKIISCCIFSENSCIVLLSFVRCFERTSIKMIINCLEILERCLSHVVWRTGLELWLCF